MSVGVSKTIFVVGLVVAILASSVLSTVVTTQLARGPKGEKGDTGPQGSQGIQGSQGPPGPYVPDYDSGWIDVTDKPGQYFNVTHGLNSTDIIVDITGKTTLDGGIHRRNLGGTDYVLDRGRTYVPGTAMSLIKTNDGGYAIAGYTTSGGTSGVDFQLVKTDGSWNTQWSKSYAHVGTSDDMANCVFQTSDGGYALIGSSESTARGAYGYDIWLVKTDSSGIAQWNKTYGGTNTDYAYSAVQSSDGGYALAGYTNSYGAGSNDFWLVKTDSAGIAQWNKTYGGGDDDIATSLIKTSDGGYALTGYTMSFGAGSTDFYLVKTDSDGNMQWNKTYGGGDGDYAYSAVQTSDGGYALAGLTYSYAPAQSGDIWLVKTDSAGTVQWNKTYGGTGYYEADSVIQMSDGGYALAGLTTSYGAGYYDSLLVKTDSTGTVQWNRTEGGTDADFAKSLVQTSDGGYLFAGYTYSFGAGTPNYPNFWLVKTDSSGVLQWVHDRFKYGLALTDSTNNAITLYRGASDFYWNYVRVRIWKTKTP
jgi:hypothetical protein